ncbi:MAG: tyrosine-type recombinase/integrase, partial [Anaerovoracaceae bacterium]
MAVKKQLKIHNKSDKPDNIVLKEHEIIADCEAIERQLPNFMRGYFAYLKGNVLPMTRNAYLHDIQFFCNYLINETDISCGSKPAEITTKEFDSIKAVDINIFIDYCRRYEKETDEAIFVFENSNKTLARKKSSLSVLFKQLFRDEMISKNITDGFDPIRVPKPGEREIKALQDNEVMIMLDAVSTGTGLTDKERQYWEKTKFRDKAILMIFLTYGLRLSELQQLNVSSFNFNRGEFKIYRKRGKESTMPLNESVLQVINDYLELERGVGTEKKLKLNNLDNNLNDNNDIVSENNKGININESTKQVDADALFLSLQGRRMTERQIRELVKKYTSIGLKTS